MWGALQEHQHVKNFSHVVIMWLCNYLFAHCCISYWISFCFIVSCFILICITRISVIAWGLFDLFNWTLEGSYGRHPVSRANLSEAAYLGSSVTSGKSWPGMIVKTFLALLCSVELCLKEENKSVWHHLLPVPLGIVAVLAPEWNIATSTSVGLTFNFEATGDWC